MNNLYTAKEIVRFARKISKKEIRDFIKNTKVELINENITFQELEIIKNLIACLILFNKTIFHDDLDILFTIKTKKESENVPIMRYLFTKEKELYEVVRTNIKLIIKSAKEYCRNYIESINYISKFCISSCMHEVRHRIQAHNKMGNNFNQSTLDAIETMFFFDKINVDSCSSEKEKSEYKKYLLCYDELDSRLIENIFLNIINTNNLISLEEITDILTTKSVVL